MEDLKTLEFPELLDKLSAHTYTFTKMLKYGATKEQFDLYRQEIQELQQEIELRRAFESLDTNKNAAAL